MDQGIFFSAGKMRSLFSILVTKAVRCPGIFCLTFLFQAALFLWAPVLAAADIEGSSDHPMLTRFPETEIAAYSHMQFERAWRPLAPSTREGFSDGEWVEGGFTWIVYNAPANRSTLEIYRNYKKALTEAGFKIDFNCKKEECGYKFINKMLDISGRMVGGSERWIPETGRFLSASLAREEGEVWVNLLIHEYTSEGESRIRLEIIEPGAPRRPAGLKGKEVGNKSVKYDEASIAAATSTRDGFGDVLELEGEIEWKAIRYDSSVSAYEAFASNRNGYAEKGYRVLFECHLASCGNNFIRRIVELNGNVIGGGEQWSQESGHYLLAKLSSPRKLEYISLLTYLHPKGHAISRTLSVKPQDIEFDLISVTGETMANEIDKSGRVAVYGIYFDTDSANIKPDSATTLAEIARLLKLRPDLTLYIDGHTDDQGSDDYNLDLSKKRATAVVAALVEHHGVGSGRLEPRGLGESQPVAVNDSEEGRSWNRRVELVAR